MTQQSNGHTTKYDHWTAKSKFSSSNPRVFLNIFVRNRKLDFDPLTEQNKFVRSTYSSSRYVCMFM